MADDSQVPVALRGMLDRGAMERVLARATELASTGSDSPDGMTEAQLLEIAKEVGLSPAVVQQALAEERTRVVLAEEVGMEARVLGPAAVTAARVVPHPPEQVIAAVDEWMEREYRFTPKRRFGNRRTWEPRTGALHKLDQTLRGNNAAKALTRATEVALSVSAVGDGRSAVRFDADLVAQRRNRRNGGAALVAAGGTIGMVPVILGSVLAPIAMLPLFVAFAAVPLIGFGVGGMQMMRGYRAQAERAQLALEQLLDRLEHGPMPRSALGAGQANPLLTETISAVAQGMRDVARAVSDAAGSKRPR